MPMLGNDPVNLIDPTGMCTMRAAAVAGTAALVDGPIPVGDAVGVVILGVACVGVILAIEPPDPPVNPISASDRNVSRNDNGGPRVDDPEPPKNDKDVTILSINQINKDIRQGRAPKGVERADKGKVKGEQDHIHINGGALNKDGTWKHKPKNP